MEGREAAARASDSRLPRTRYTEGRYVDALTILMRGSPGDDGFVDRIHWL